MENNFELLTKIARHRIIRLNQCSLEEPKVSVRLNLPFFLRLQLWKENLLKELLDQDLLYSDKTSYL